ncbi:MAG: aldehyde ferredoxin oxidoreductase C-terminal domain-containing protein [Methanomassiliicoccales archaeon]
MDMTELKAKYEDVPEKWKNLGGRGLTSTIVADEVPPTCHPLGPNNKVVLAPGIVTGTSAPTSGRISVGGKSPLTGGIKEANAGTNFAQKIAKLGIKAIIVQGQRKGSFYGVKITKDKVEFFDAKPWVGKGLYEVYPQLREIFGKNIAICSTGIAGEIGGAGAGVCFNDVDGLPSRYAGRGGLGAVMGTRGLKFIIADDEGAPGVEIKDKERFKEGTRKLTAALQKHDITKPGGTLNSYGTDALINVINEAGALPHRNFSAGYDELAPLVSGEKKAEIIKKRGGERPHVCSPGCIIQCSEVWVKEGGKDPVGVLEYESVWALGPNCGIYNLDDVGELNRACNDLGLDTIEMGGTIGVAMEGGIIKFGDGKGALCLLEEVRRKSPLGRIIANGTEFTGKAFGVTRIPTVKGQSIPAYDPRPIKGIGVTYATTPMGADHTAGYAIAPEILGVGGKVDPLDKKKADLSRALQQSTAFIDSSGYCLFTAFAIMDIPEGFEGMVESCNGVLGTNWSVDDAVKLGAKILEVERKFNKAAGFTKAQDRLPEFMTLEPLPPKNVVYDVPNDELDRVFPE